MWREVRRTYHQEIVTTADGKKDTQLKSHDVVVRDLTKGSTGSFGGPEIGSRLEMTILDDDRVSVRATNNILRRLRLGVLDPVTQDMEGKLGDYYAGVVEKKSIVAQIDESAEHFVLEWYPKPETPIVSGEIPVQAEVTPASQQSQADSVPNTRVTGLTEEEQYVFHARALARLAGIRWGNLLPPEAGQAIAERQKYPTLPSGFRVTPSIPSGQDPRPPEYYTGNRGSGFPVLPPSLQTRRIPGDHRPPGYHEGGPGPSGLPPWAQPPKGPVGR